MAGVDTKESVTGVLAALSHVGHSPGGGSSHTCVTVVVVLFGFPVPLEELELLLEELETAELEEVELLELATAPEEDELEESGELLEDEEIPDDELEDDCALLELEDAIPEDELDVDEELGLPVLDEDELKADEELDELLVLRDDELDGVEEELFEPVGTLELDELDGFQGVSEELLELVGGKGVCEELLELLGSGRINDELLDELKDELLELLGAFDELLEVTGLFDEEELLMNLLRGTMMSAMRTKFRVFVNAHAM